jgi:hypothetical protein
MAAVGQGLKANGEIVTGDLDYDGRVILYIIKGWWNGMLLLVLVC